MIIVLFSSVSALSEKKLNVQKKMSISDYRLGYFQECVADFDNNGVIDTRDWTTFFNALVSGDYGADVDGDGAVTVYDFFAFKNLWIEARANGGC